MLSTLKFNSNFSNCYYWLYVGLLRSMLSFCPHRLQTGLPEHMAHLQRRNCRNEIFKTNFHTEIPLIHFFHRLCTTFSLPEHYSYLFGDKKTKYIENTSFRLASLLHIARRTRKTHRIEWIFLTYKPRNANSRNI